jgi:DNA replication and repair protein RecF
MAETVTFGSHEGTVNGALSIKRLKLTNYRCYEFARLEVDDRPVVLTGPNGAGKTNLLEAISYLVPGRGLRGAKLSDVGRNVSALGENRLGWAVAAQIGHDGKIVDIGTGLDTGYSDPNRERRVIKIDGKNRMRQSELGKYASALWLTPQMDQLFIGGSSSRRRFLDNLIIGIDRDHAGLVSAYEHSMRSRNKLLKENRRDEKWLGSIEEDIARYGVAVAAKRQDVVERLNQLAQADPGTFPSAHITIIGLIESLLDEFPALEVEERVRSELVTLRSTDNDMRGPKIGPHRSDLVVLNVTSGLEASQCSTGEQKALLVRIILAATSLNALEKGQIPLLLLDEVAAHLDTTRRKALFDTICKMGIQAWMTGTDEQIFRSLGTRVQHFSISDAKIEQTKIHQSLENN